MPCYEPRDREERIVYVNGIDPFEVRHKLTDLNDKIKKLEASLCAIITELEKRGIANEIISQASKSGLIDIMNFWHEHKQEDYTRLAKELHKFSEHEQDVLRKILNGAK